MSGGLLSVRRSNFQLEITNPGVSYIYGVVVGWRARFSLVTFGNTRLETPIVVSENELPEVSQRRRSKSVESGLSSPIRGPRRLFRRSARAETTPRRALGRGRPGSTASTPCIIRAQHFGPDALDEEAAAAARSSTPMPRVDAQSARSTLERCARTTRAFRLDAACKSHKRSVAHHHTVCVSDANTDTRGGRIRPARRGGCTRRPVGSILARDRRNLYITHLTTGVLLLRTRGLLPRAEFDSRISGA